MDLNEWAKIKKNIQRDKKKDQYSQYGLFFSFIYLRNSKMCQSIKDSHKSQGNKQTKKKNHKSHLKHHCLVLIGITNKECVWNAEGWCERERFTLMYVPDALLFPSAQLQQDLTVIARRVPLENKWIVLK